MNPNESTKLHEILEAQLKKFPNYVTETGELKKWVVLDKAQKFNFDEKRTLPNTSLKLGIAHDRQIVSVNRLLNTVPAVIFQILKR